jgi:alpha-L-fucosidase
MRNTWFWRTDNLPTLKTIDQLMDMYDRSVGRGAVLLLNNTPDKSGLIPEPDARRSAEFGAEIKRRYGTAVIDTAGTGGLTEMGLSAPRQINTIVTMEDITQGERVREYVVEGRVNGAWQALAKGTAIGHKRIDKFAPVEVSELRLRVTRSAAKPVIRRFAAYWIEPSPAAR